MKRILFAVTNDLNSDQRMWRVCTTLQAAGYEVQLVGRQLPQSRSLPKRAYEQYRMRLWFQKGPLFYAEFNIRLFLYALGSRVDAYSAVDLDTLPAFFAAARLRSKPLCFDAHEIFTEVPELTNGGIKQRIWQKIESLLLPQLKFAYTVNHSLAQWYSQKHGIQMAVVRNMPFERPFTPTANEGFILYQGALNAGRGLAELLEAAPQLPTNILIAGRGDLEAEVRAIIGRLNLEQRVQLVGQLDPEALQQLTAKAWLGVNLLEAHSLNYYYSLANKFFDYVQAGIPQLGMDYPEYALLNAEYEVSVLLPELKTDQVVQAINQLWNDPQKYQRMQEQAMLAAQKWTWEAECPTLLDVYARVFAANSTI